MEMVSDKEFEGVYDILWDGTDEEIEAVGKKYAGRLRYGYSWIRYGSFRMILDGSAVHAKTYDEPNCVKIYGNEHPF